MSKETFPSVDAYLAARPEEVQSILNKVRATIRKALPNAEEGISYNIPTYKVEGRAVLYFAGWKEHYSLYPVGARLLAAIEDDPAQYDVDKSTLRFAFTARVPVKLIARIAKLRAEEVAEPRGRSAGTPATRSPARRKSK